MKVSFLLQNKQFLFFVLVSGFISGLLPERIAKVFRSVAPLSVSGGLHLLLEAVISCVLPLS